MSSEWKEVKISEICTLLYGKNLPSEIRSSTGAIPVYGSSGITGYHNEAYVNEPGIIIGRKGTVGAINYSSKPFWPIDTTYYIPSSSVENIKYIYYLFKTIDFKKLSSDSAVPGLNRDAAHSLKIKIPSTSEQKTIANLLSSLDDKIELNRQMCKTLEDIASTLFKSWFIDFDPVKAKAAGLKPEGLSPEIAELFPDSFVDSSLGLVPSGWTVGKFTDFVSQIKTSLNPLAHSTEQFIHYSLPAFDNNKIPIKQHGDSIKSNKTIIPNKCVLLSKLNPEIERIWFLDEEHLLRSVCSTEFLAYIPKKYFSCEYIYCIFRSSSFQLQLKGMVTGTSKSHQRVQPKYILDLNCLVPPNHLITIFNKITTEILKKSNKIKYQSCIINEIRNKLINKLIKR